MADIQACIQMGRVMAADIQATADVATVNAALPSFYAQLLAMPPSEQWVSVGMMMAALLMGMPEEERPIGGAALATIAGKQAMRQTDPLALAPVMGSA